ncbi:MAG TPA: DUF488 family protein [Nocardioidaceae bacterium]
MGKVTVERVREYVKEDRRRGSAVVFLVDRVWPRGVAKKDLDVDAWVKEVAPSTDLRKWFNHDPQRWPEFRRRYLDELDEHSDVAQPLLDALREGDVLLLFDAKDFAHNQAVVLADWLRDRSEL